MNLSTLVLLLSATAALAQHSLTGTLTNPNANAITKNLFKFIVSNYGKHIISGQQDVNSYNWVKTNIGKSPAILGVDMMDYSPGRVEYGASSNEVENAIAHHNNGGIVTFVWHWGAPSGLYNSASQPWYSGFYSEASSFNLGNALANTNGNDYKLLIRDIDAIATQLKRLQSAGVPVLWRPLHEAEGGWFWWGRNKDYTSCKKLWAIMYDRMTNYHGLNNLIWVWNSIASNWYPGDSTVDIVSADLYPSAGDHSPQTGSYNSLKSLVGDRKPVALSECGVIPDPAQMQSASAHWSWFCTWNGNFIQDGNYNSRSFLTSLYNSAWVLTLDEISGWKTGTGVTTTSGPVTTTTTRPTSTTTSPSTGGTVALWGQCGGQGWTGGTQCVSGSTCQAVSPPWYSQCRP
ncbi:carbohydrate-binding module family 1 protein [Serendipita vermifera MAFF 305830]|uniref:Carbohydrate-binding module family 1 protein n=1 Tax=Serendipita vermifera MAFF 305830 TaxID=933852 RepID=A0A0C3B2C5_SERVB|nr:carbohydrate-binding module family 1 protein [Serendipita vermifera MAFF 305830]